jgi:hypothetical protein
LEKWPYSKALFLPHADRDDPAPQTGEIFRQPDLLASLRKLVETEPSRRKAEHSIISQPLFLPLKAARNPLETLPS